MTISIQRLGPGDEAILIRLATEDADFDVAGRGEPIRPLDAETTQRYLSNPTVLHWVALENNTLIGTLYCIFLPLGAGDPGELLLYEIGVHQLWRRRGIGRFLIAEMENWMRLHYVNDVWVLADNPIAVEFYRACGFTIENPQPVYMTRHLQEDHPET